MMDKFYKVDGHSGLLKNPVTGTILNANTNEIKSARARKANKLQGIQETQQMKDDITQLKNDMSDIKTLLKQIAEK
jgi:hypothetical protein